MNWLFFGSDEFSLKVLETLLPSPLGRPVAIISLADQPAGRHQQLSSPPIVTWAQQNNFTYQQISSFKTTALSVETPCDFFLVASFGKLIPADIFNRPRYGTINIHPSLLPRYRGPTPIETAILQAESDNGVSLMLIDEQLDHGPLLAQRKIDLPLQSDFYYWRDHLASAGAELLVDIWSDYSQGILSPQPQAETLATYTRKFNKADGYLDLTGDPMLNYRRYLAFKHWPGVYTEVTKGSDKIRVLIKEAELLNDTFVPRLVIPAGRRLMSWEDFQRSLK